MRKNIKIGVFGYGCVGQGLFNVLQQTQGIRAEIVKICVKDKSKKRNLEPSFFTYDKEELLNDKNIQVIVELIDDPIAALEIVKTAMKNGKAVVSANKKMIAENLKELKQLQEEYQVPFLYEGSCCASIPIIRNLEEYYDNDLLSSVEGVFNGSTNYILTKIIDEGLTFTEALAEAQEKGYAETDPTLDVQGFDAKFKLCIILAHSFGLFIDPKAIFNCGIDKVSEFDVNYAREKAYKIKLLSFCRKSNNSIFAVVIPSFVEETNKLYHVDSEYNAVSLESVFSEHQFFSGKGAGSNATGSAVLSDISALTHHYKYEYKKSRQNQDLQFTNDFNIKLYIRYKKNLPISKDLFNKVDEEYYGSEYAYAVGDVNIQQLLDSAILDRRDVNVIALPSSQNEPELAGKNELVLQEI